jgi:hypothetical protein
VIHQGGNLQNFLRIIIKIGLKISILLSLKEVFATDIPKGQKDTYGAKFLKNMFNFLPYLTI